MNDLIATQKSVVGTYVEFDTELEIEMFLASTHSYWLSPYIALIKNTELYTRFTLYTRSNVTYREITL